MQVPAEPAIRKTYQSHLHEIGKRPQIFAKISEVFRRVDGQVPTGLKVYRSTLDEIFSVSEKTG
jgi:L-fuconolactonase